MGLRGIAATPQEPTEGQTLQGLPTPTQSPLTASLQGASPDAAKMAGTPRQRESALKRMVSEVPGARLASQLERRQQQEQDEASQDTVALLAKFPQLQQTIAQQLQANILATKNPLSQEAQTEWSPKATPEIKEALRKLFQGEATQEQLAEAAKALGKAPTDNITPEDIAQYVSEKDAPKVLRAWQEKLNTTTVSDSMSPGQASQIAAVLGKQAKDLTWADVQNYTKQVQEKAFANPAQLRKDMNDPSLSPQARALARERLVELGYAGTLSDESLATSITEQMAAGTPIRIGNKVFGIDELRDNPEFISEVERALTDPEYRAELAKDERNAPFLAWANDPENRAEIFSVADTTSADLKAYNENREAYRQNARAFTGFENVAKDVFGLDLASGKVEFDKLPPQQAAIFNLLRSKNPEEQQKGQAYLKTLGALSSSMSPATAQTLLQDPEKLNQIMALDADPRKAVETYTSMLASEQLNKRINATTGDSPKLRQNLQQAEQALARIPRTLEKPNPARGVPGQPKTITVPNPAYTAAFDKVGQLRRELAQNNTEALQATGLQPQNMQVLADPDLSKYVTTLPGYGNLSPKLKQALASPGALANTLSSLAGRASNTSLPLAERLKAQQELDSLTKVAKAIDPRSKEAMATKQGAVRAKEVESYLDWQEGPGKNLSQKIANFDSRVQNILNMGKKITITNGKTKYDGQDLRSWETYVDQLEKEVPAQLQNVQAQLAATKNVPDAQRKLRAQLKELQDIQAKVKKAREKVSAHRSGKSSTAAAFPDKRVQQREQLAQGSRPLTEKEKDAFYGQKKTQEKQLRGK